MLNRVPKDQFVGPAKALSDLVSLGLHDRDGIHHGNDHHYLTCGASAMNVISAALQRAGIIPGAVLDFGSGAGRVTRWLRAAAPEARIFVTDLRPDDLAFCTSAFGAISFPGGIHVDELISPAQYDLIWVGSVLTHLSEPTCEALTRKLMSWLNPTGVLVMSFHGRFVLARAAVFEHYGIQEGWDEIVTDLDAKGFGYADCPNQSGYGISISTLAWMTRLVERIPDARLVLLEERAWDGHHDVVAIQKRPVLEGL